MRRTFGLSLICLGLIAATCVAQAPAVGPSNDRPAIGIACIGTAAAHAQPPAKRLDPHGDALPPGAVTRIGSIRFRHDAPLGHVHFSGDGKTLLGTCQASRLWDVDSGKQLPQFRGKLLGDDLALSPDGKFLADHSAGLARLWDIAAGKVVRTWGGASTPMKKDDFSAYWPRFSGDGKTLLIQGKQGDREVIRRFDLKTGAEARLYEMPAESSSQYKQLSPDGRLLLEESGELFLVDLDTGKKLRTFENSSEPGYWFGTQFSPDGKTVIGVAEEREVFIWNAATGKLVHKVANGRAGYKCLRESAFSPDGRLFTINDGHDANALIYETATGKLLRSVCNGGLLNRCVFSGDSKLLLVPATNEISVWEVATGKKICRFDFTLGPDGTEAGVAFSPDGKRIAFTDDRLIRVGDVATGKLIHPQDKGSHFMPGALVFSQDGKALTIGDHSGAFHAWDAATGKHLKGYSKTERWSALACARDGKMLAALNYLEELYVWDVRADKQVQYFGDGIRCWRRQTAFSADARLLATTSDDGDIHVFNVAGGEKLHRLQWYAKPEEAVKHWGDDTPMLAFSPDGRSLAAFGLSRPSKAPLSKADPHVWVIRVWELASGKERRRFHVDEREQGYGAWTGLKWTADGKALAVSSGDVVLFSVVTGKEVRRFSRPRGLNGAAAVFSADGKLLAAPGADGMIYVWETATATLLGQFRCPFDKATVLAFAPDGKRLATAGTDTTVVVWDLEYFLRQGAPDRTQLDAS